MLAMLVLLPMSSTQAQDPLPTPVPTTSPITGTGIDCTVAVGPDSIDVECSGAPLADGSTRMAANSTALAEVFCVGCPSSSGASSGANAEPRAGEEPVVADLVAVELVEVDANGAVAFETLVPFCGIDELRFRATGVTEAGDPIQVTDAIDDADVLVCAADTVSSTPVDWLQWFALGLLLLTASAWIASVRDQH